MKTLTGLIAATALAATCSISLAQSPPSPGDAHPPGALRQGGIPPAAAMRRGDDMEAARTGGEAQFGRTAMHHKMKHKKVSMRHKKDM